MKTSTLVITVLVMASLVGTFFLTKDMWFPMSRQQAKDILGESRYNENWETGFVVARARAVLRSKENFKYQGQEYSTKTGKSL